MMASAGKKKKILIIVENLPSPFDRRVWQEATTLLEYGHEVSIICPKGKGYNNKYEVIDGIHIYRHSLPFEADGALGYLVEYSAALFWEFYLAFKVLFTRGFDVIHGCNPPDLIFIVGGFFKIFGKKFVFDHHDINPELYEAKFGKKDFFYKIMVLLEKLTFKTANISIATNESYKKIAIERGCMDPEKVHIIRSGPKLDRLKIIPPVVNLKKGKKFLVGYVGVIGKQEGVDHLLRAVHYIVNDRNRHDVHFTIVGSGTELNTLKNYAKELTIENYVTFTGRVPDQELLDNLNTADVCVNPDIANEMNDKSTMNKIMEYMALAKPIVQYDLTEGHFSAQQASLYAEKNNEKDFADKILILLDDPALRKIMGQFGRNRVVNELEWEYEAPKLIAAYDTLWSDDFVTVKEY
jgi:glycosyltransferase involved in cell wall biosynthesis